MPYRLFTMPFTEQCIWCYFETFWHIAASRIIKGLANYIMCLGTFNWDYMKDINICDALFEDDTYTSHNPHIFPYIFMFLDIIHFIIIIWIVILTAFIHFNCNSGLPIQCSLARIWMGRNWSIIKRTPPLNQHALYDINLSIFPVTKLWPKTFFFWTHVANIYYAKNHVLANDI